MEAQPAAPTATRVSTSSRRRVGRKVVADTVANFFDEAKLSARYPSTQASGVTLRPELLEKQRRSTSSSAVVTSTLATPKLPPISPRNTVAQGSDTQTICQRARFPLPIRTVIDESGLGARSRATQLRAEELLSDFLERRSEQIKLIKAHCSQDMYSDGYDAINGAEEAILYVGRPITEDDFRQPPKPSDFESRFADMMTLFLHKDLAPVMDDGKGSGSPRAAPSRSSALSSHDHPVDYASLRFMSRQFLDEQEGLTDEAKKATLYKSFRVLQGQGKSPDTSALVRPALVPNVGELEGTTNVSETWQESDGSDSEEEGHR